MSESAPTFLFTDPSAVPSPGLPIHIANTARRLIGYQGTIADVVAIINQSAGSTRGSSPPAMSPHAGSSDTDPSDAASTPPDRYQVFGFAPVARDLMGNPSDGWVEVRKFQRGGSAGLAADRWRVLTVKEIQP